MFPAFQLQIEDEEEAFLIPEVAGEVVFHHMALMVAIIQDSEEGAHTGMFLLGCFVYVTYFSYGLCH